MNIENILSQMGIEHGTDSTHHGDHKQSAALSALTLLAFLFFLNILQQCLKDHMTSMNPPQVMIMSVGREDEENLIKMTGSNKLDKSGVVKSDVVDGKIKAKAEKLHNSATRKSEKNVEAKASTLSGENEKLFTKINITEHTPNRIRPNKIIRKNTVNRSSGNIFLNTMNSVK